MLFVFISGDLLYIMPTGDRLFINSYIMKSKKRNKRLMFVGTSQSWDEMWDSMKKWCEGWQKYNYAYVKSKTNNYWKKLYKRACYSSVFQKREAKLDIGHTLLLLPNNFWLIYWQCESLLANIYQKTRIIKQISHLKFGIILKWCRIDRDWTVYVYFMYSLSCSLRYCTCVGFSKKYPTFGESISHPLTF